MRFRRNCRHFIGYINFNWETDVQWKEFKDTNMKGIENPRQIEEVKREYYKMNVNERLDTSFIMETQSERDEFLDMCKFIASILSLNQLNKKQGSMTKGLCHFKSFCYFLYVVFYPLGG